jgi:hypothetical protein
MHTSKGAEEGLDSLEGRCLPTVSYTKAPLIDKLVDLSVLDKMQRNIGLLTSVLKSGELQFVTFHLYS